MTIPRPSPSPVELDSELWRFAVAFYRRPDVAPACLVLQNQLGVDVSFLIFAIFAELKRGYRLDANHLAAADGVIGAWRTEIVQSLRHLRTRLKSGPLPAPQSLTEGLRQQIKAAELEAEQIELAALANWLDRRPGRPAEPPADAAAILSRVIRHFAPQLRDGETPPEIAEALRTLTTSINQAATSG